MNGVRTGLHAVLTLCAVLSLTAAALVAWRVEQPSQPPALDVRSIPAPLRTPPQRTPLREVRVCVTSGAVDELRMKLPRRGTWRVLDTGRIISATHEPELLVRSDDKGLVCGRQRFPARVEFVPESSPGVWIDDHLYRGRIRLIARPEGKLIAVNVLPVEEYVASVIDGEMPATFPIEARRAQAVVARTYVLARQAVAAHDSEFDVFASERSQKYLGVEYKSGGRRLAGESASSREAAAATRDMVLTYEGRIFTAYYSAVCGGCTTNGRELFPDAAACHRSVPCDFCQDADRYRWTTRLSTGEFRNAINELDRGRVSSIRRIRMLQPPGSGALSWFEVRDDRRAVQLTGWDLRQVLQSPRMHSPHVSVKIDGQQVIIDGRGHGHGVGFCQWGARGQAHAGRNWRQILMHYYPGAELSIMR